MATMNESEISMPGDKGKTVAARSIGTLDCLKDDEQPKKGEKR
jgi:hypothetical protein